MFAKRERTSNAPLRPRTREENRGSVRANRAVSAPMRGLPCPCGAESPLGVVVHRRSHAVLMTTDTCRCSWWSVLMSPPWSATQEVLGVRRT